MHLPKHQPSPEKISRHIYKLASDKMKGRGTGSRENEKAAEYVAKQFKKYGLAPKGTDGFYQPFTAKVRRVVVPDSLRETNNVIGFLDNGAEYTIVIGAHFDHLGTGQTRQFESRKSGRTDPQRRRRQCFGRGRACWNWRVIFPKTM